MTKNTSFLLLFVFFIVLVGLVGWILWMPKSIDSTDKVYKQAYDGAQAVFDAQLVTIPFVPYGSPEGTQPFNNQVTVKWVPPQKTFNHFLMTITNPATGWSRTEAGEHDRTSLDPDGLEPGEEYVITLQACIDKRCQEWLVAKEEVRVTMSVDTADAKLTPGGR